MLRLNEVRDFLKQGYSCGGKSLFLWLFIESSGYPANSLGGLKTPRPSE